FFGSWRLNGPECQYHVVIPDLRTGIPYAVIGRTFGNKQLPVLCLSANLGLPHDIDTLAHLASMSRRTLTRHFHSATGMTVWEWITTERLRRSQELLESTDIAVERVAELAGFQSTITFRQIFRQRMGVSPSEWRKTFNGTPEGNIPAGKETEK
ncbi:helix-turn-helix domain-containing protein, partial [Bacillus sp. SS-TM]